MTKPDMVATTAPSCTITVAVVPIWRCHSGGGVDGGHRCNRSRQRSQSLWVEGIKQRACRCPGEISCQLHGGLFAGFGVGILGCSNKL